MRAQHQQTVDVNITPPLPPEALAAPGSRPERAATDEPKAPLPEGAPADPREGHRGRVRQKFMDNGLEKFTDEEVLELLLSFGTPRKDCKQTARAMLKTFGTIREVFEATPEKLAEVKGAGPVNIVAIKFIHAVAGKYLEKRLVGRTYINSAAQVLSYLRHELESRDKEIFKVIYLDGGNAVIEVEDKSRGTITGAYVHPREIMETGLKLMAAGLVFAHNHPSGESRPSREDQLLTRRLVHGAGLLEMKVQDHLIIGRGGDYFSFRDSGLLNEYEMENQMFYRSGAKPAGGLLHEDPKPASGPQKRPRTKAK